MAGSLFERSEYPTLEDCVYLNQASLGLMGQATVDEMHRFLEDVARHGNTRMSDADEASFANELRERASVLLGAPPIRIAITSGASELLGQVPFLLPPPAGATVVVVSNDFPAVTRPWLRLARSGACQIELVQDEASRDLTSALIDAIDDATSHVAVSSVQYATGTRIDVARLAAATARADARLVIDAT